MKYICYTILVVMLISCSSNQEKIMGEWQVVDFAVYNAEDIPKKLLEHTQDIALSLTYTFNKDFTYALESTFDPSLNEVSHWYLKGENELVLSHQTASYNKQAYFEHQTIQKIDNEKMKWKLIYGMGIVGVITLEKIN